MNSYPDRLEPKSHSLRELLDIAELPKLIVGDTFPFEKGSIDELYAAALILVDSMGKDKPVLASDKSNLKKRVQHDKITGLRLNQIELVNLGDFELSINSTMRRTRGWETRVTGSMHYPGYGEVQLDFPFVVLESSSFYRFGPYDRDRRIITHVSNPEIRRALSASQNLGAFAIGGASRKTGKKSTGIQDGI